MKLEEIISEIEVLEIKGDATCEINAVQIDIGKTFQSVVPIVWEGEHLREKSFRL